jgi:hypothetical protein
MGFAMALKSAKLEMQGKNLLTMRAGNNLMTARDVKGAILLVRKLGREIVHMH